MALPEVNPLQKQNTFKYNGAVVLGAVCCKSIQKVSAVSVAKAFKRYLRHLLQKYSKGIRCICCKSIQKVCAASVAKVLKRYVLHG